MENITVYNQISANKCKSWLIMLVFSLFVVSVGYIFARALGYGSSMFVILIIITVLTNVFGYYFSDSLVLSMSGANLIDEKSNPEIYHLVENLCIGAGMPKPKIHLIDDSAPNAFATGRDPKHASIALTSGLLKKLNKLELEGVIGHELSHIKNFDTRLMVIVSVLVGFVALLGDWFIRASWFGGRDRENRGGGLFFVIGLILAILSPIVAQLIRAAVSRQRELLADASSALLTRYPDALADALLKISQDREPLEVANKATAHLYIVNPLKNYSDWISGLFSTHPPIAERVKLLRAM